MNRVLALQQRANEAQQRVDAAERQLRALLTREAPPEIRQAGLLCDTAFDPLTLLAELVVA